MSEKKTYAGTIPNTGVAVVEALQPAKTVKKPDVAKGNDLRSGKTGK